jgi:hypothetical protein
MNERSAEPATPQTGTPCPAHATELGDKEACLALEGPIQEAAAVLWTLFDDAYCRASARETLAGPPDCTREVITPSERHYGRSGKHGEQHSIAISLVLSVIEGRVRGGAFLNTSRPYLSLFFTPVTKRGQVRWRAGTAGHVLSSDLVEDLFLSVLDDEADATRRLAPLVANSLG